MSFIVSGKYDCFHYLNAGPDGRCFHVAPTCILFVMFISTDRKRIRFNSRVTTNTEDEHWKMLSSWWGNVFLQCIVNKFQRPAIPIPNIEDLTARTMSILYHLATQFQALIFLLQETDCTSAREVSL